jgi:hypothetical protein
MPWRDLFFFLGLIFLVYFISRSAIGQRNPDEKWPQWVERIGKRDVPQVVRSDWFGWLAWLARRLLPFVMALAGVETVNYLAGNEPLYYLNALDWVAIQCIACVICCGLCLRQASASWPAGQMGSVRLCRAIHGRRTGICDRGTWNGDMASCA